MSSLTERGKTFEAEYSRNQELAFRIVARRNRLFGLWAAAKIGLAEGEERETYAKAVIAADFQAPGDDDIVAKVHGDLAAKGVTIAEAELRAALARAATQARQQVLAQDPALGAPSR